ncbi:MAG: hypothetical protein IJW64_02100 [Clostridia bacterium]|nr:hypothetical protein [Clostridia bacterium]
MKIRELLVDVARILEDEELANAISTLTENQNQTHKVKTERLLYAYNMVLSDVSLNYLAPTFTEKVAGKIFNMDDLSQICKKILSVTDDDGNAISYKLNRNQVILSKDGGTVTYEYIPKNKKIDDDFEHENKLISTRAFCYGVCAEYCLFCSRYEEAQNWENKFRQATEVKTDFKPKRLKAGARWGL